MMCATKVDEFCGGVICNDDVLELDVEVDNVVRVEVVECGGNVSETTTSGACGQSVLCEDLGEEIAGGGVLENERQMRLVRGDARRGARYTVKRDDIRVRLWNVDGHLAAGVVRQIVRRDNFDGEFCVWVLVVRGDVHGAGVSLCNM